VIEKMMRAEWAHGELNARLAGLLFPLVRAAGALIGTDVVIRVDSTTVRAFDLAVIRPGVSPTKILTGDQVLLAIEVAETTHSRDLGAKREEYGAAGIPTYWVADLIEKSVHVFRLDPERAAYGEPIVLRFGEAIEVPGLAARSPST